MIRRDRNHVTSNLMSRKLHRVLLDTDIGSDVDDALALLFALRHPAISLEGVTTVSGDAHFRARLAKALLTLAGREKLPVYAGLDLPLMRSTKPYWHGREGEGVLDPARAVAIDGERAPLWLIDRLMSEPHVYDVVAVGPLTNLAAALIIEPRIAGAVRSVTLMGTHVWPSAESRHRPPMEHNIQSDPEAARLVLSTDWPLLVMPLEVTCRVRCSRADGQRWLASGDRLNVAIARMLEIWLELTGQDETPLHDPLAVMALVEPAPFTMTRTRIRVATGDTSLAGMAIAAPDDERLPELSLVCEVNVEQAHAHYMTVAG